MVLNSHKPYDSDTSGDEDPWEMISECETETTPLAASARIPTVPAAVPNQAAGGDIISDKRESEQEQEQEQEAVLKNDDKNDIGQDGNASFVSGVSSITGDGDHHTVSEVDEESLGDESNVDERDSPDEDVAQASSAADENSPEEKSDESSDPDPLVEQLSQMGFEKKQIEKAIGDLREAGATDIDVDSVIGSMVGENNTDADANAGSAPLSSTWDFVESTVQDLDRRHQLRHRTQSCMRNINQSTKDFWSHVTNESQQFRSSFRETCDQADVHARNATTSAKFAAISAKDSVCRANEQYRITEKLATVAVVGGATLLALGNPRAGVGAIAVAGATLAAGEAMKQSSAQSPPRDYGLNEDLHID